jgi:hypothetical protein
MRHALGARVRIEDIVGDGRHGHIAGDGVRSRHGGSVARHRVARHRVARHRGGIVVGRGIRAQIVTERLGELLGVVGELGELRGDARSGALLLELGLAEGLGLLAPLQVSALTATKQHPEAGATIRLVRHGGGLGLGFGRVRVRAPNASRVLYSYVSPTWPRGRPL